MLPDQYYTVYLSDRTNLLLRRLYINIERGRLYNTRYLLDNTNLKLAGDSGRFALYLVVKIPMVKSRAKHTLFKWLLEAGCDCNHVDGKGISVLLWLLGTSELELAKILLNKKKMDLDYTFTDRNNNSSLMYAVRTRNFEMVTILTDILLSFGIELDVRNKKGYTPYAEALNLKLNDIARFLVQTGKISVNVSKEPFECKQRKCKTIKFSQMRINLSRSSRVPLITSNNTIPSKSAKSCSSNNENKEDIIDDSNEVIISNKNSDKPRLKVYADYTHPKKPPPPSEHIPKAGDLEITTNKSIFHLDETSGMMVPLLDSITPPTHQNKTMERPQNFSTNEHNSSKSRKISIRPNQLEVLIEDGEEIENEKKRPKSPDATDGRTSKLGMSAVSGLRKFSKSGERFRNLASVMAMAKQSMRVYQQQKPPPREITYITYADVKQMIPQHPVNINRTSTDELKWLMLLQSDQRTNSFTKSRSEVIAEMEAKKTEELLAQRKDDHSIMGMGLKREKKKSVFIAQRKHSEMVGCSTVGHKHLVDT